MCNGAPFTIDVIETLYSLTTFDAAKGQKGHFRTGERGALGSGLGIYI